MRKGSIFILVLWALFFLTLLAVAINAYVWPRLGVAAQLSRRAKAYYLAQAGYKKAVLILDRDITDSYDALKEPWSTNEEAFKEIALGEGTASIKYPVLNPPESSGEYRYGLVDEERKININKASHAILKNFLKIVGQISAYQAASIAAAIIDWRDGDEEPFINGAESSYYLTLQPPYPCKNAHFQVLEELLLIKGMTHEIFNAIKGRVTLYGVGAININTADELVLRSVGMSEILAEKIMRFREGPDGQEATGDDNVFEFVGTIIETLTDYESLTEGELAQLQMIVNAGLLSVRSDNFTVYSWGELPHKKYSFKVKAIINRNKVVKYWRQE